MSKKLEDALLKLREEGTLDNFLDILHNKENVYWKDVPDIVYLGLGRKSNLYTVREEINEALSNITLRDLI